MIAIHWAVFILVMKNMVKYHQNRDIPLNHPFSTSRTAQGGGGCFKNRKPIGEVGCCSGCNVCSGHLTTTAGYSVV